MKLNGIIKKENIYSLMKKIAKNKVGWRSYNVVTIKRTRDE